MGVCIILAIRWMPQYAMKEIGNVLNLTIRTVAFHKYRIMQVLGAKSSADLVRYAVWNDVIAG